MTHHINTIGTIHKKPDWSFYVAWISVTFLCMPIAYLLDLGVLRLITSFVGDFIYVNGVQHITEDYLGMYTLVPIVGLLTGILQYSLLQRYLPRMGWWILATIGGWLLGIFLIVLMIRFGWRGTAYNLDAIFMTMGFSIGTGQWLLLQRRLPQAGWWILANVAGWGLLALITTGNSIDQYGLFSLGLFPACVTAAVLALLMKRVQLAEP